MKRILKLIFVFAIILIAVGCGKDDKKTVLNKFDKKVNNTNGYQVEAEMELINNDDSYKYDVTVSYKKNDNYRVSLRNRINNHEQIILKNKDGVYVLSPNLNKSFKFQSRWPYDNSQSYLIGSVLNDLKNDPNTSMKKINNNYVFKSTVNYKNNSNLKYQKVIVDKNYNIKEVIVYDNEDKKQIIVKYNIVDMKAKFNDNYFDLDENMNSNISDEEEEDKDTINELESAIYPMYLPDGTYLDTEKTVKKDNGSRIILTFSGTSPFMLIEENAVRENEMTTVPTSGDIDLFASGIMIIDDTSVSFINDNIEYYLVSSEISSNELINVAKSMYVMPVSK